MESAGGSAAHSSDVLLSEVPGILLAVEVSDGLRRADDRQQQVDALRPFFVAVQVLLLDLLAPAFCDFLVLQVFVYPRHDVIVVLQSGVVVTFDDVSTQCAHRVTECHHTDDLTQDNKRALCRIRRQDVPVSHRAERRCCKV